MSTLLSCGSNAHSQLSHNGFAGEDSHVFQPAHFSVSDGVELPSNVKILELSCHGANHTVALVQIASPDGALSTAVWGTGDNRNGQLAFGEYVEQVEVFTPLPLDAQQPKLIGSAWESTFIVFSGADSDTIVLYGSLASTMILPNRRQTLEIPSLVEGQPTRVKQIFCGPRHILFHVCQDSRNYLVGMGASRHGQLGRQAKFIDKLEIVHFEQEQLPLSCALGLNHTAFVTNSDLVTRGRNGSVSVLLQGDEYALSSTWNATFVLSRRTRAVKAFGTLFGSSVPDTLVFTEYSNAGTATSVEICGGSEHLLFKLQFDNHDDIWVYGWNEHGNLGLNNTENADDLLKLAYPGSNVEGFWAGCGTSWLLVRP